MDVEIKLLQNWSCGGADYRTGDRLKIDKAIATLLVNTSAAEMESAGATGDTAPALESKSTKAATTESAKTLTLDDVRTVVTAALREEATKAVQVAKGPGVRVVKERIDDDPLRGYKNPRMLMLDVLQVGQKGPDVPDSQLPTGLKTLRVHGKAAGSDEHGEYADPYGGFLIPEAWSPEILRIDPETDPMTGRTKMVPMQSVTVPFQARVDKDHSTSVSGGLTVARDMETVKKTSSRMKFEQVKLTAHGLFGFAYASEDLLTDSPVSFAAILAQGFGDEFTSAIINERLNGTGVGEYMGVMSSPCLLSINKEDDQVADTLKYENVINMRARCWRYHQAIWLANHTTIPQLMLMNVKVGVGGAPVWQPSAREDHPDILLGRPIVFTEYCKIVGDKGDLVLGNWGEYLEGVLQPLQTAESIHVRFDRHERAFKFWVRNAGAPWWRSVLTPKNGDTLSPFVVLNERA